MPIRINTQRFVSVATIRERVNGIAVKRCDLAGREGMVKVMRFLPLGAALAWPTQNCMNTDVGLNVCNLER